MIISWYEVHNTFVGDIKKKKELEKQRFFFLHFKVNLFYIMHVESSKLRAPTHDLN